MAGYCIPFRFRCDGTIDCDDVNADDERNCGVCSTVRSMTCKGQDGMEQCLPLVLECDGHDDCGDYSDERGCGMLTANFVYCFDVDTHNVF